MEQPPSHNAHLLLAECWQQARASSTAAQDPLLERFKLAIKPQQAAASLTAAAGRTQHDGAAVSAGVARASIMELPVQMLYTPRHLVRAFT